MNPVNSDYIHFIESQTTVSVKPWYKKVERWEADAKVETWRKAWLMTGGDMRDLGLDVADDQISCFFNIGEDPILQSYITRVRHPAGNIMFETYISFNE